jgi:trehalose 6-phosphate synthase/phosphatase
VAVSNRLPIVLGQDSEGLPEVKRGSGGLVTALAPVLRNRGGLWIGWAGVTGEVDPSVLDQASREAGYRLHPVPLSTGEVDLYYGSFANAALWPLFHDLPGRTTYHPPAWEAYQDVNRRFAEVIAECSHPEDYVWVQDYHLLLAGRELRALGHPGKVGFFLHIPFPSLDMFLQLPWRAQILSGLLEYDLIGFQTVRDRRNFLHCVKRLVPGVRTARGTGAVVSLSYGDREVRVGSFPISIDYQEFARQAGEWPVAEGSEWLREALGKRRIILGVDRLDYTKGIPQRLEAYRVALERYPQLRGGVVLVQVAVPSREDVPEYQQLKMEIERLVGEINGEYSEMDWIPIHYLYRSLSRDQLLTYYRAAHVALITPLRDGMNLVAKEYCAAHVDDDGVLILSDFAGAASQLHRWALTVNPHDTEGIADAIFRAVEMPQGERRYRMRRLRTSIRRNDIYNWVDGYLEAGVAKHLDDFPQVEDYIPPLASCEP